jgi:hypothetical protein
VPFGGGSYEIRVKGRLSDSLLAAFEGLTSLGLELVEIRRLPGLADELPAETDASPVPGVDDRGGGAGGAG